MASPSDRSGADRRGAEGGFVLLEVLIALVIFATIVLAWSRATDNALVNAADANADRTLRMLAARKLAEIRAKPQEFAEGGEGGFEEETGAGGENPFLDYRWQVESEERLVGHSPDPDAVYVSDRDAEAPSAEVQPGEKALDPIPLLMFTLVVTHVPEGSDEGESMRAVVYVPAPPETPAGGGSR